MTPWNTQKYAKIFSVLKNPFTLPMLNDLADGPKNFTYFSNKHGHAITWPLQQLVSHGLIIKIRDEAKIPIGYKITDHGRWVLHSTVNFSKEITVIQ